MLSNYFPCLNPSCDHFFYAKGLAVQDCFCIANKCLTCDTPNLSDHLDNISNLGPVLLYWPSISMPTLAQDWHVPGANAGPSMINPMLGTTSLAQGWLFMLPICPISDHSLTFRMTRDGDCVPGSTRDAVYRDVTCGYWCWLKDKVRGVAGGHMTDLTPQVETSRCYDNKQGMIKSNAPLLT